ncbi:tRNA pseudouridine synthase B [Abditibacteriota bacterium]|nr:tRNA pseudouridine synthase B [Abditibacteriota bacterium]
MQHGVLNFLKPPGMTSHDAVAFVRRVLKEKRVGHTGTLDPAAAGVLPICVGQATRLVEDLQAGTKRYIAEAQFGRETDSGDLLGHTVRECDASTLQLEEVRTALDGFRGEIEQTPPLHSAIKVGGQKLYDLARQGKEIEIPTRRVTISHLHISRWQEGDSPRAMLDIECSGGTYIRSLVRDIGRSVGNAATMSFLLRNRSGFFSLADAVSPEEFEREPKLVSLREALDWLALWTVQNDEMAFALWQGKRVAPENSPLSLTPRKDREEEQAMREARPVSISRIVAVDGPVLVENESSTLLALTSRTEDGFWKAEKVFDLR